MIQEIQEIVNASRVEELRPVLKRFYKRILLLHATGHRTRIDELSINSTKTEQVLSLIKSRAFNLSLSLQIMPRRARLRGRNRLFNSAVLEHVPTVLILPTDQFLSWNCSVVVAYH